MFAGLTPVTDVLFGWIGRPTIHRRQVSFLHNINETSLKHPVLEFLGRVEVSPYATSSLKAIKERLLQR